MSLAELVATRSEPEQVDPDGIDVGAFAERARSVVEMLRGLEATSPAWTVRRGEFPNLRGRALRSFACDQIAVEVFRAHYGFPRLGPLCIVIPAFEEEANIGGVLTAIPREICGVGVTVLVVADGCTDGTARAARRAGAYVCESPFNRGQGSAFRIGYRLAVDGGARYVATLDADGQYRADDIAILLAPVMAGEADIAQGSRRMGHAEKDDPVRKAGVYFFSVLISALMGRRITDSSNGLRVMHAAVPTMVRLDEDQYQSSEMLIGAVRCGFRYIERPVAVVRRSSGRSKKAPNVLYGLQYLRVVLTARFRARSRRHGAPRLSRRLVRAAMAAVAPAVRAAPEVSPVPPTTSEGRAETVLLARR